MRRHSRGADRAARHAPRPRPAALRAGVLAHGVRRDELPPLLRHHRPGRRCASRKRRVRLHARARPRLAADGVITGLRIDHIDGLRDPQATSAAAEAGPRPRAASPCTPSSRRSSSARSDSRRLGMRGHDRLRVPDLVTGLLIDPAGHEQLNAFYARMTGDAKPFGELVREKKLLVMDRLFGGELTALARTWPASPALTRTPRGQPCPGHGQHERLPDVHAQPARAAADRRPHRGRPPPTRRSRSPTSPRAIDALRRVALLETAPVTDATLDWVMRWQQFTGPVMAKGFEDTALYCHNALLAANEVGSDPAAPPPPGAPAPTARGPAGPSPGSLNATATHDTKRGEDTRARIAVCRRSPTNGGALRRWIRRATSGRRNSPRTTTPRCPKPTWTACSTRRWSGPGRRRRGRRRSRSGSRST
jgi:maltooligosyltrehalose synthase